MKLWTRRDFLQYSALGIAGASSLAALACAPKGGSQVPQAATQLPEESMTFMENAYFSKAFGVTEAEIEKTLLAALNHGADWSELYFEHTKNLNLTLRDGIVSQAASSVDLGVGCRAVLDDQVGYAYTESLDLKDMMSAAKSAAVIASGQAKKTIQAPQAVTDYSKQYNIEADWDIVEVAHLVSMLQAMEKKAFAADKDIEKVTIAFNFEQKRIMIASSEGVRAEDSQPKAVLSLSLVMNRDGERQSNGTNIGTRAMLDYFTEDRIDGMIADLVARTRILYEARKPKGGEMPVVLGAGASGILLHEAIGHGMEADFNRKDISIFSTMIGKQVAIDEINIIDSGLHRELNGSLNLDDEGTPCQETLLVENGILRSYLHDNISAAHYGLKSTGSGRRESFRFMPYPRMRQTYMTAGERSLDDLFKGIDYGVFCTHFTNGQVDIGAGDYTFYVKNGYLIEDGKLTAPIKDVNIIGNGPDTLSKITKVGDTLEMHEGAWQCGKNGQGVPVSVGMPAVLVSSLTVGGE